MTKQDFMEMLKMSLGGSSSNSSEKDKKKITAEIKWFEAVRAGDRNSLKKAIKSGFNIDYKNAKGQTALMVATYNNDVKISKFLIENGADVNIQDDRLNNPFLYAGAEGYLDILKLIGTKGDVKRLNRYGGIGIIPASERAHLETLQWLLEHTDSDVNHVNNLGWTALLEAIILGDGTEKYVKTVDLLIAHGASPHIADRDGVTAIEHAEKLGYKKILKKLK